jgi:hypothetical protein
MIGRGEMVCGGDAISCDGNGCPMDMACLSCKWEWFSRVFEDALFAD